MFSPLLRRLITLQDVPQRIVVLTVVVAALGIGVGIEQSWPIWAIGLAGLLPFVPIFTLETIWTHRHYEWLAVFYILVVTQVGHFGEHVAQMIEIHVLNLTGPDARGIFGALDVEWVHFIWNTWIIVAAVLMLMVASFRKNRWLWLTLAIAGWHELEHGYIMSVYLTTGVAGTPGLLAKGGLIDGGLPLTRADLHFIYNLIETTPLVLAFIWQLKHTYDEWLARALPHLSEQQLVEITHHVKTLQFAPGEVIVRQGDPSDRFYIITQGEVSATCVDPNGKEMQLGTYEIGNYFGEVGLLTQTPRTATIRAKTAVEVLALDRATFQMMIKNSEATAGVLVSAVQQRLGLQ
jgi:cyclic nucleotide-binding protein